MGYFRDGLGSDSDVGRNQRGQEGAARLAQEHRYMESAERVQEQEVKHLGMVLTPHVESLEAKSQNPQINPTIQD